MAETNLDKKFRFIPFRKRDIVEMCLQDEQLPGQEDDFRQLYHVLSSILHYEFHKLAESLKDAYAAVDPDTDTRQIAIDTNSPDSEFVELLSYLLEKANYERITKEEINQALEKSSLFRIRLQINFDDFSEVLLFCRGESIRQETVPRFMGLFPKTIAFINYERAVIYIQFKDDYQHEKGHMPSCRPGSTLLKMFRNVPKSDLEMLFPNTLVRMRLLDKLLIGIPAAISGGVVLTTKMGASLVVLGSLIGFWLGLSSQPVELNKTAVTALLAGAIALGSYLWKQFNNFKNRKLRFMQALTQNLYFKNLDNNAGVFHRLIDDAEEEECKEAILAYYFLLISDTPLSRTELDREIESWLASKWGCLVDFEINDALNKLLNLGLIKEDTDSRLTTIPIAESIDKLDQRWDDYFTAPK